MWLTLVAWRPCIAPEHSIELLRRRLWEVACRRHGGLQWRKLRRVCTRRRWRRSVVALGRGRRRVGVLPGGRLPRRLLLGCVGAVLIAANLLLLLLLLLLRSGKIRGGGRGVHWGIPRSGPRGHVVGIGRQVLRVSVGAGSGTAVLLLVVGICVLHWHVAVQVAIVIVRHVSAGASRRREAQVGSATRDRGRVVGVVLDRRSARGGIEGGWRRGSVCTLTGRSGGSAGVGYSMPGKGSDVLAGLLVWVTPVAVHRNGTRLWRGVGRSSQHRGGGSLSLSLSLSLSEAGVGAQRRVGIRVPRESQLETTEASKAVRATNWVGQL
jgi:hypothetical protein